MTDHPQVSSGKAIRMIVLLCVVSATLTRADTHPAKFVPTQSAAFIVFPKLAESNARIGGFLAGVKPGFPGLDLAEFEMTAGFAPRTMDLSRPIILIAERPEDLMRLLAGTGLSEGDSTWPIIGFMPADPAGFANSLRGDRTRHGGVQSVVGAFGRYRVVMRDGFAFVAARGSTLAKIARLSADESEWSRMSEAARDDATTSDVFVQISMAAWRPLYEAKLQAVVELMKLGIQLQQPDPARIDQTRKLADWFFSGALDAVRQMDSASAGLSFDGERFRLSHHHTFRSDDWLADYLRHVTRKGSSDAWRAFPDDPFLMGLSSNWNVPPELCLAVRFNRRCMDDPELCKSLSKDDRLGLDREISALTAGTTAEEFVVTSPSGQLMPFRMSGSYLAKDATKMLVSMQKVRDHSQEVVGSLIPGAAEIGGKTHLIQINGLNVFQMRLVDASESQLVRTNIANMYGADALYQEAAIGDDTIVYSIGDRTGVQKLAEVVRGERPSMSKNDRVREAMGAMPSDANLLLLVDTQRFVKSIPFLMRTGIGAAPADTARRVDDKSVDAVGPLLGWSATVRGNHIDCAFTMKAGDLQETIMAFHQMGRTLSNPSTGGAGSNSGLAADRPVPFAMGD
ncbi:MAG: hypothetical protein H6818_21825 [Phycisphaerales bacterium]|nr:hypothetical protein [Phycisphaerales bacterium]MCB9862431.1 hypothetical protein [Phycisphaerales bacterium]